MLGYKKIHHFKNEHQSGRACVGLLGDFFLVNFLFVIKEVFSVLLDDLQKHDENSTWFFKELQWDIFLYLQQVLCKDINNTEVFVVNFFCIKKVCYLCEQLWLGVFKVLEQTRPILSAHWRLHLKSLNLAKIVEKLILLFLNIFVENLAQILLFILSHFSLGDRALGKDAGMFVLYMGV